MWIQTNSGWLINLDYVSGIGIDNLDDNNNIKYAVAIIIPHNNERGYIGTYNSKEEAENLVCIIRQRLVNKDNLIIL